MTKKNPLIAGTLILTGAGLITRIIGFFNRIYLSRIIGPEEMGIYQLIFPVYMVAFALCCHGMELALSQMVAEFFARQKQDFVKPLIFTASCLSVSLASILAFLIWNFADFISIHILNEGSSAICLRIVAPIMPFTAFRCCMHGYYIGLKKTAVPALGQLIEQLTRVGAIWLISSYYTIAENAAYKASTIFDGQEFGASLAVMGMIAGEICGTLFTFICYEAETRKLHRLQTSSHTLSPKHDKNVPVPLTIEILKRTIPLTGNKLSLTLMSSLEAVLIPYMLTYYYQDKSLALSMYGILTGMALPFIMFPSTITNSLSVMLLPTISEANAVHNERQIHRTIEKTVKLCLTLGFTALVFFFFFGKHLGIFVFHNESAGDFLFILSFLCPFLYLSSSGTSILNGLGLMKNAFFYNLIGLLIRILFIVGAVPVMGIQGYLIGLLAAYGVMVLMQMYKIFKTI